MSFDFLQTSPQWIPGIGPLFGRRLAESGFRTFFDLLAHLPARYTLYSDDALPSNGPVYMEIQLGTMQGRHPWKISCTSLSGQPLNLVFFQRPKPIWVLGTRMWIKGVLSSGAHGPQIIHPERAAPWPLQPGETRIVPEYTLPKGITPLRFSSWIKYILQHWPDQNWSPIQSGPIQPPVQNSESPQNLQGPSFFEISPDRLPWYTCFSQAHFPQSKETMDGNAPWRRALAYSEWVAQHIASAQWHEKDGHDSPLNVCSAPNTVIEERFLQNFGYPLTPSQHTAWKIISEELTVGKPMMRLLNGDVGSGKTLVAFLALIQVALSGKQACLMAPTETLIRQHFSALTEHLRDIPVQLILGKGLRIGPSDAPIILGTHALLYDSVQFRDLALAVIDEQQRFGVQQRLTIMKKGSNPHVLFLSATPIPRTFQRLACGQMDVSIIEKRPSAVALTSYVLSSEKIDDLRPWIQRCITQKECVYWVCPAIEDEELGVHTRYAYWEALFPGQVGCMHGRLSAEEKDHAMMQFRTGLKPILVTTTVIEVGIHIATASTIFIEESPRFGLSQLHQLRGRVGRDVVAGHCFFLYTPELTFGARKRLQLMRTCQDGFKIAEQDWLWRGSGTLFGTQQSGHNTMRFIHMDHHGPLALSSAHDAEHILSHHPERRASLLDLFGYSGPEVLAAG
jgi:ATP-dependent DNA helicase RecG